MNKVFDELKLTGKLPTPTGVGMQILELTQTDEFSAEDIAKAIAGDPALTGRVLRMANSAVNASIKAVVTVQEALVRLGVRTVRNVALSFSLISSHRDGQCAGFDYQRFWAEALLSGVAASALSKALRLAPPPEAYIVGLLHGIGRLAFASVHPDRYAGVLTKSGGRQEAQLRSLEAEAFGIDHCELAEAMLRDWRLAEAHCRAVGAIEDESRIAALTESAAKKFVDALRLTRLAGKLCAASEGVPAAEDVKLFNEAVAKFGVDASAAQRLVNEIVDEWRAWTETLGINMKAASVAVAEPAAAKAAPKAAPVAAPAASATALANASSSGAKAAQSTLGEGVRSSRPLRILAVDDDKLSLTLLVKHLENAGHQVFTARDGREALQVALEKNPELVVTDWVMPIMDGVDLTRALRRYNDGKRMYVILLTGTGDEDRVVEAFDAGVDDFVVKPFKPRVLLARVRASERVVTLQQQVENDARLMAEKMAELAILNRRFQEMSHTDALTGLYNRRYAMQRLGEEWSSFERYGKPFSVIMVDIDHFKSVNDQHGHDAGDEVLKQVAKLLRSLCRESEVVCRLGGEEFLVLCENTDLKGAVLCAERLRATSERTVINFRTFNRSVTLSLGVAEAAGTVKSLDELLKLSDEGVYRAKESGRNRVSIAESVPTPV